MSIFQTTQSYASAVSLNYDKEKERYIGELVSRGGVYHIEGVDRADVMYQTEQVLREEYAEMTRNVGRLSRGARGIGGGGGGSSHRPERVEGMPIYTTDADARHKSSSGRGSWVEAILGAVFSAITLSSNEWFDGVKSIWDKEPVAKIFAVSFGGILITATSRKLLKKKLIRQRNIRIQRIMNNVRKHDNELENASSTDNISKAAKRLRSKKKRAQILTPKYWERKISPQGQETGWKSKSIDLRNRMHDKKDRAKELWACRV